MNLNIILLNIFHKEVKNDGFNLKFANEFRYFINNLRILYKTLLIMKPYLKSCKVMVVVTLGKGMGSKKTSQNGIQQEQQVVGKKKIVGAHVRFTSYAWGFFCRTDLCSDGKK